MSGLREIIFDTETTGFDARGDDRVTEIGAIEVIDMVPTGGHFHSYVDPQRDVPERVVELTGLTREFLTGKPLFADIARDFLAFVGDSPIVAHNADFDRGFINAELLRAGFEPIEKKRFIDTVKIAREKFPGSPASLDALCKRFDISLAGREQHGALIDAHLLLEVYIDLKGARMRRLKFDDPHQTPTGSMPQLHPAKTRPVPLAPFLTETERAAHEAFIAELGGGDKGAVWQYYQKKIKKKG